MGEREAFPRWAELAATGGVVTMHREVFPGLFVGGPWCPAPPWLPQSVHVVDVRDATEPAPERVGPEGAAEVPVGVVPFDALTAIWGLCSEVTCAPFGVDGDGVPSCTRSYRAAVSAVVRWWGVARPVLVLSTWGAVRGPLVAYGALRLMGFAPAEARRRVVVMPDDAEMQTPAAAAFAWVESLLRIAPDREGPEPEAVR